MQSPADADNCVGIRCTAGVLTTDAFSSALGTVIAATERKEGSIIDTKSKTIAKRILHPCGCVSLS
jgi:hypothetical protein